jgi:hypothetical protein
MNSITLHCKNIKKSKKKVFDRNGKQKNVDILRVRKRDRELLPDLC